jgi:tRNA A-37 threonylcarbamoyl transferase component Bud32
MTDPETLSVTADLTDPPESVAPVVDPYIGKTFDGRYLVEAILGEGGMGVVYRARHKVIDKKVAIKVLRGEMARNKEVTDRFLQEARAASSIGNPHIIDISDFGTLADGSTYFVMEFLGGKSLTDVMAEVRPMPLPRLLSIAKQIASGLHAAHDAGIVHRDLKPDNVIILQRSTPGSSASTSSGRDFVKILDFGIAKVGGEASRLTQAGSIFGTPHYMSPEQAAGTQVDHRTDIYALGIILYEMASGKVPFDADNFMGILTQHMYKAAVPILALVPAPEVPPGLDAIIQKCLSKKVEGRYKSMDELIHDLEKVEQGVHPDALAEMMGRSGSFAIPGDYFRISAMPAPVHATPPGREAGRGRGPLVIAIAAVATIGIAILAVSLLRTGQAQGTVGTSVQPPPVQTAPTAVNVVAAPLDPPRPSTTTVTLAVTPLGAKVVKIGSTTNLNDTGALKTHGMIEVVVDPSFPTMLEVSAPGFKPAIVSADGKASVLRVDLEALPQPKVAPAVVKPKTPHKCRPGDELCDPFG